MFQTLKKKKKKIHLPLILGQPSHCAQFRDEINRLRVTSVDVTARWFGNEQRLRRVLNFFLIAIKKVSPIRHGLPIFQGEHRLRILAEVDVVDPVGLLVVHRHNDLAF